MGISEAVQPQPVVSDYPFERMLIPLDGSGPAEGAFSAAQAFSHRHPIQVVLARIVEPGSAVSVQETVRLAELYLRKAAALIESSSVQAKTVVRVGPAAETLLAVAREEQVSLVTMSTHGRLTPSTLPFGNVAGALLQSSRIPILAVGAGIPGHSSLVFRTILVVSRPEDPAEGAAPAAVDLALSTGADLAVLLRLVPPSLSGREEAEHRIEGEAHLGKLARRFESKRIATAQVVQGGDPAAAVLDVARRREADVIAMCGPSGDEVAGEVLKGAACPVFLSPTTPAAD